MIRITFILLALCFSVQGHCQSSAAIAKFRQMEWLLGNWNRTNAKPGRSASEHWVKVNDRQWKGKGVILRGADTTFVEKLQIVIERDKLYYVADVPENKGLVYFEITSVTDNGFICENPQHDFPKKIAYSRNGNTVTAIISAGAKSITYQFERIP